MTITDLPDDLSGLTDEELDAKSEELREAAEALQPEAAKDDAKLAELTKLGDQYDAIKAERTARANREAERAATVAEALNRFTDDEAVGDDAAADSAPVDEVADQAAAATEAPETAEAPASEAAAPAAQAEASQNTAVATAAPAPTAPLEDAVTTTPTTAAVAEATPAAYSARDEESTTALQGRPAPTRASNAVKGKAENEVISRMELATEIADKRHGFGNTSVGTYDRIVMGQSAANLTYKVGNGEEANFAVLDAVRKAHVAEREANMESLVASGGVCAPLAPSYEFFRLAEEMNPVEGALPVVAADRGGIRYIVPPDFRDASGGVRVTTEAEDAAGYPPTAPKPCIKVSCPPVEECRVDAVSQCVTFGNLNYRVFPEQVNAFLADLAVIFTQVKEVFYLDAIDAASTNVTFSPEYGAVRGITYTLLAAAANYRRRHHMAPEATLSLFLPSWVVEFVKVDLINDHSMGLGFIGADIGQVNQVFASMNLDVTWYYDSATGAGQAFDQAQAPGPLNQFPSTVVGYLFAPGTFVRLNGGTLDVGLVRDSILNGTNDLQLFSEEWIQVCQPGLESLRLEIALCPDGTGPEPVLPLDCLAVSA